MKQTYIIAEIGINHNGDMGIAKELIESASNSGCDAVKLQKRDINSVYTQEELDKPRESPWGTTNREQKEGLELSLSEYQELEEFTKALDMDFIVSCWDLKSLALIEDNLSVSAHKVASALLTDRSFLEALKATNKPVMLSTGMSTQEDVDKAMEVLGDSVTVIMACTSTYPTKAEEINLTYIQTLKELYPNLKVGFSNHYSGALACHGAVAAGAEVLEFHVTKDRSMYGSDQSASIENIDALVKGVRVMELMVGDGIKVVYPDEVPIAEKLRKVNTL